MIDKAVFILTTYQAQDEIRGEHCHWMDERNIVLRLNYVPQGSIVFMTGINVDIWRRDHGKEYDIRDYCDIYKYKRSRLGVHEDD